MVFFPVAAFRQITRPTNYGVILSTNHWPRTEVLKLAPTEVGHGVKQSNTHIFEAIGLKLSRNGLLKLPAYYRR